MDQSLVKGAGMRRLITAIGAFGLFAALAASVWAANVPGTKGNDKLHGTPGADTISGGPGNDTISGLAGNDVLNGGVGNDTITGGPGADKVVCGTGHDTVHADAVDKIAADCEVILGLPKPALSVAGGSQAEGNSGAQPMTFTVTLAKATPLKVTVAYASANGTATAGSDFTASSGNLVFSPGETSKTVSVPIIGDTIGEPDETFTLALSNPVNAVLGQASGTGTITNDDPSPHAGHYAGTTSQGKPIAFDVASDMNSLANLAFTVALTCQFPDGIGVIPNLAISFGADDPWTFDPSKNWGDPFNAGNDVLQLSGSIHGSFDATGHASGTLQVDGVLHTDSGDANCSSKPLTWTAQ
jgi:hypothetical protein